MSKHYVPCLVAVDVSYEARALRAGILDGFHGYPEQSHVGKALKEQEAYKKGYAQGKSRRV